MAGATGGTAGIDRPARLEGVVSGVPGGAAEPQQVPAASAYARKNAPPVAYLTMPSRLGSAVRRVTIRVDLEVARTAVANPHLDGWGHLRDIFRN